MDANNLWISSLLLNYADGIIITKTYLREWIHREINNPYQSIKSTCIYVIEKAFF